ncbi:MAG: cation:proton antiporter, partial [Candidatus Eremiobacteraeota bacterium]|nr:cation:proton antiporter [Candidatus Eremiobacteraeota bacterium]
AGQVVPQFFIVSIGGIVVGIVLAWLLHFLMRWLHKHYPEDAVLPALLSLTTPYAAYLGAEALSVSGVLSTVAAGMWLSRRSGQMFTPNSRLVVSNVWEMTTSVLNAFVFLLLGLQLHNIVSTLGRAEFQRLLGYGIAISVAVILLRFVWLYPATYIPRWASKRLRERDPAPPWQVPFVISWAGMRGIVSLAAALAVPLAIASRNEIIFVTFAVIFATLVVMGLTLPLVINTLRVRDDGTMQHREIEIRIQALEAGMQRLRELEPTFDSELEWEVEGRIVDEYRHRIEHLGGHLDSVDGEAPTENAVDHRLQREALDAERRMIQVLRRNREIPDDIYREIEYDLDLAELRLSQA